MGAMAAQVRYRATPFLVYMGSHSMLNCALSALKPTDPTVCMYVCVCVVVLDGWVVGDVVIGGKVLTIEPPPPKFYFFVPFHSPLFLSNNYS